MPDVRAMPQPGDEAPAIEADITGGGHFSLATELGHWVAVYFFPRANTPG